MKSQSIGSVIFHQLLIPVAVALFMAFICQPLYLADGTCDYTLLWLLIGIPFGIRKMVLWILPGGHATLSSSQCQGHSVPLRQTDRIWTEPWDKI